MLKIIACALKNIRHLKVVYPLIQRRYHSERASFREGIIQQWYPCANTFLTSLLNYVKITQIPLWHLVQVHFYVWLLITLVSCFPLKSTSVITDKTAKIPAGVDRKFNPFKFFTFILTPNHDYKPQANRLFLFSQVKYRKMPSLLSVKVWLFVCVRKHFCSSLHVCVCVCDTFLDI